MENRLPPINCKACGGTIDERPQGEEPQEKICPHCGAENSAFLKFKWKVYLGDLKENRKNQSKS
jgi:hypothetical protein